MTKVYLAKSNRANPDHVSVVRQTLSNFDVEVVEYKGGEYSHDDLLKCELLFIVPDSSTYDDINDSYNVGKGLFEQISEYCDSGQNIGLDVMEIPIYVYADGFDEQIKCPVSGLIDYVENDTNNYINYGEIEVSCSIHDLSSILVSFDCELKSNDDFIPVIAKSVVSSGSISGGYSRYKFLLINKNN